MATRVKEQQLSKVVAEVTRLSQLKEEETRTTLERAEVARILKDLDLPDELLDEAMIQIERREQQAKQKRRTQWTVAAVVLVVLLMFAGIGFFISSQNAALARVQAQQSQIVLTENAATGVEVVQKSDEVEVFNQVVLRDAPEGKQLPLKCRWYDPNGNVFHENTFKTKTIDKSVWPTRCKCKIGGNAPSGTWKVEMSLGDRILSTTTFKVE